MIRELAFGAARWRALDDIGEWHLIRNTPQSAGTWLYEQMLQREGEGIVLKRLSSPYQPGIRSSDWMKSIGRTADVLLRSAEWMSRN